MTNKQWKNLIYAQKEDFLMGCGMTQKEASEVMCDNIHDLPDEIKAYVLASPVIEDKNEYNSLDSCPNCGADGNGEDDVIFWGEKNADGDSAWQDAECKKCGCLFTEVYTYSHTEIKAESPV
jgi:hypothetical protein